MLINLCLSLVVALPHIGLLKRPVEALNLSIDQGMDRLGKYVYRIGCQSKAAANTRRFSIGTNGRLVCAKHWTKGSFCPSKLSLNRT
jgi:hypothetical protein